MKKKLAIFCDGTWNAPDQEKQGIPCPTNVVKLALRVAKQHQGIPQVSYYGQGVGTGASMDKMTGGAFGHGLQDNLHAAYRFLMLNYSEGDDIYLFGFSRGAYTARSLAGMIRKCGILSLRSAGQYAAALRLYCNENHPDHSEPRAFRHHHSCMRDSPTPIAFIGVWDTVGALGIPVRGLRALTAHKYKFHDVSLSSTVSYACQALAIDERRGPFEAARWTYEPGLEKRVEQVWFTGAHSDIGGGYPSDECGLSDITLEWMRDKAIERGLGMDLDVDIEYSPSPDPLAKLHNSQKGLYRLGISIDRAIGLAAEPKRQPSNADNEMDPTQSVHPSVIARWDHDPTYRPSNLLAYFKRVGDPRGTHRIAHD